MLKYWGEIYFSHGSFSEVGEIRRRKRKKERKKKKVGENNGQLRFVHVWRTQASLDQKEILNMIYNFSFLPVMLSLSLFVWLQYKCQAKLPNYWHSKMTWKPCNSPIKMKCTRHDPNTWQIVPKYIITGTQERNVGQLVL